MAKREPPIRWHNVFIFGQLLFQGLSLVFLPLVALAFAITTGGLAWDFCAIQDCTSMQRVGALWSAGGFLYVLVEELWKVTPRNMLQEIEGSFAWIDDDLDGSAEAKRKFRTFAAFTDKARLPLVRTVEVGLVVGGALLDGYGDLLSRFA